MRGPPQRVKPRAGDRDPCPHARERDPPAGTSGPQQTPCVPGRVYRPPMFGIGIPEVLLVLAVVGVWLWSRRP